MHTGESWQGLMTVQIKYSRNCVRRRNVFRIDKQNRGGSRTGGIQTTPFFFATKLSFDGYTGLSLSGTTLNTAITKGGLGGKSVV